MFSQLAMHLLTYTNAEYFGGWRYMPILIVATAYNCLATFQSTVYIVEKKSVNSMWTSMAGALLNIVLNAVLIPWIGVNGAAAATFASYFLVFILRYFNTRQFIPFNTHLPRVFINTAILGVQCAIILMQVPYWFIIEAVLFIGLTAYNFKPLLLSVKRLLKKGDKTPQEG